MIAEDDADIIRTLFTHNPWWTTGEVPSAFTLDFRRRDFYKLREDLENREITGIVGARRVGKTTLMYQLVDSLLADVVPQRVLYLKVDDPYLAISQEKMKRIFDLYAIQVLRKPLEGLEEKIYVMLDEIQVLEDWELFLKRWFDLGYNIKFIVSGSSSPQIVKDSAESLVGRFHPQMVCPMKFLEVVRYNKRDVDFNRKYDQVNWKLREAFRIGVQRDDSSIVYQAFREASLELAPEKDWILIKLHDYLLRGGYPAIVAIEDRYRSTEILRDYLSLTIYKDIVKTFGIRDPKSFESLFVILASECSQRHNYLNLSNELGIKRDTIRDYLYYLTNSYLISESRFYSKNVRTQMRRDKKIYINDNGLRNAVLGLIDGETLRDPVQLGKITENAVADHCKRLKFNLEGGTGTSLNYWYGTKGHEVDLVLSLYQKPIPIEVKYRQDFSQSDLKGMREFISKYNTKVNLVVTKQTLNYVDDKILIPLWLFLLFC